MSTDTIQIRLYCDEDPGLEITNLLRSYLPQDKACNDNFKHAVSTHIAVVRYDAFLVGKLTSAHSIRVEVDEDEARLFTGRIAPQAVITSSGVALDGEADVEDITLEIEDLSYMMEKELTAESGIVLFNPVVCDPAQPANSIVHRLIAHAGLTPAITETIPVTLLAVSIESGTCGAQLDTLLFEYGYNWDLDSNGNVILHHWMFNYPTPSDFFDESNIIGAITAEKLYTEADAVEVIWHSLKERSGALLYMADLPFGEDSRRSGWPIQPGYLWPEEANPIEGIEQSIWWDYNDSTLQSKVVAGKVIKNTDFNSIVATHNHSIDDRFDTGIICESLEYKNRKARVTYRNQTAESKLIFNSNILGDVVYRGIENKTLLEVGTNPKQTTTYKAQYIHSSAAADALCLALGAKARDGSWKYTFQSETVVELGTIVELTDSYSDIHSIAIIIECTRDIEHGIFSYRAIGLSGSGILETAPGSSLILIPPRIATDSIEYRLEDTVPKTEVYAPPANVSEIFTSALQDYIEVRWTEPKGNEPRYNPAGYILQRSTDGGVTWFDIAGAFDGHARIQGSVYYWKFNRSSDGYPEPTENFGYTPLSNYRFRIKAINSAGYESVDWATSLAVSTANYKTWKPGQLSGQSQTAMRAASISWPALTAYGLLRYEIQISLDGTNWYEPAVGLDIYASENNWRQSSTTGGVKHTSLEQWNQELPLSGQTSGAPVNTTYLYRVRAVLDMPQASDDAANWIYKTSDSKRAGAWSSNIAAIAKATSAYDVVKARNPDGTAVVGALQSDNIYVENLAAINGNLAVLSGGVDDPNNYWTLSDYPGRPVDRDVGELRAGNATKYVKIKPSTGDLLLKNMDIVSGDRYANDGSIADSSKAGVFIGSNGTLKASDSDGSGFEMIPGVGATFTGINLELNESDLKTFTGAGLTLKSMSHEALGLTWRDNTDATLGGLVYYTNDYIYLYSGSALGVTDIRISSTQEDIALRLNGTVRLQVTPDSVNVYGGRLMLLHQNDAPTAGLLQVVNTGTGLLAEFMHYDTVMNPRLRIFGDANGITIQETYSNTATKLMFQIASTQKMVIAGDGVTIRQTGGDIILGYGASSSTYTLRVGVHDTGITFENTSTIRGFTFSNASRTLLTLAHGGGVSIPGSLSVMGLGGRARTSGVLAQYGTTIIPAGTYYYISTAYVDVKDSAGYWRMISCEGSDRAGLIFSDGVNMRFRGGLSNAVNWMLINIGV